MIQNRYVIRYKTLRALQTCAATMEYVEASNCRAAEFAVRMRSAAAQQQALRERRQQLHQRAQQQLHEANTQLSDAAEAAPTAALTPGKRD